MARRLVLGQARIFTNKSDMKPVPLWVGCLGEGERPVCHRTRVYTPRAGLVTVSQSPFLEEASPLCSSLIWWPNLGTEDRNPTLKSPVYSLWGLGRSYPYNIALGSNPARLLLAMGLWVQAQGSWKLATAPHP